jgi:hypothetical protein
MASEGISKISLRQGGDHIAQFVTKLLKDLPAIANPPNIASQCVALLKAFPENTPDYYRVVAVLTTYAERGWGVSALARELKEGLTNHRASATHNILSGYRTATLGSHEASAQTSATNATHSYSATFRGSSGRAVFSRHLSI